MGQLETAVMMLAYKQWADAVVYKSLTELAEDELRKPRQTTFGSILGTLHHVFIVDDIFRHHLTNRRHAYTSRTSSVLPSFSALEKAVTEMDAWYLAAASDWTPQQAEETIAFDYIGGGTGRLTRQEITLHIVNHTTYHRGFVGDMLRQIPHIWPANDLTVFLRDVWPSRQNHAD